MYVSRAVESLRETPVEDAEVTLVLEPADDTDPDAVADAAAEVGTVERRLQFGDVAVTVPHERIDDACAIDGLAAVQTADTIDSHPDEAEEDVDLGG